MPASASVTPPSVTTCLLPSLPPLLLIPPCPPRPCLVCPLGLSVCPLYSIRRAMRRAQEGALLLLFLLLCPAPPPDRHPTHPNRFPLPLAAHIPLLLTSPVPCDTLFWPLTPSAPRSPLPTPPLMHSDVHPKYQTCSKTLRLIATQRPHLIPLPLPLCHPQGIVPCLQAAVHTPHATRLTLDLQYTQGSTRISTRKREGSTGRFAEVLESDTVVQGQNARRYGLRCRQFEGQQRVGSD